jgi:pimeloyl-ACP methyl ester carboxylesterase
LVPVRPVREKRLVGISRSLPMLGRICSNEHNGARRHDLDQAFRVCMNRPVAVSLRLSCVLICALLFGCAETVKTFYLPKAVIHPEFDKRYTVWNGERVEINWAPTLRVESSKYLARYDRALLANSIHQIGLRHEYKIAGKGTPLVVYTKNPKQTPEERHYPTSGITLGITAVKEARPGQVPLLKIYDSFDPVVVRSAAGPDPIAANYTATLAVLYSHARKVARSSFESFIRPDDPRFATGVYLIHPYDPNKIPILFVHGLLGTPLSWQNLTNDLCSDPKVLEHYQPWFFLYPTGQPMLESAAQLREDLQATQRLFDPSGNAIASHHVVVVAHSMGGLLTHTLVSDSGDALWNVFATKPLNSLRLPADVKDLVLRYFFFRHQPSIDRVIFLSVPHRGSILAGGIVGGIGNRIIEPSKAPTRVLKDLAAQYPGLLDPYYARVSASGGPTSLVSITPNPLLNRLANLPVKVPFHSIIGHLGPIEGPGSTDGLVDYHSSHLEGAESEKIVPAGHYLMDHPETVAEIKRILEKNIARGRRSFKRARHACVPDRLGALDGRSPSFLRSNRKRRTCSCSRARSPRLQDCCYRVFVSSSLYNSCDVDGPHDTVVERTGTTLGIAGAWSIKGNPALGIVRCLSESCGKEVGFSWELGLFAR